MRWEAESTGFRPSQSVSRIIPSAGQPPPVSIEFSNRITLPEELMCKKERHRPRSYLFHEQL